MKKILAIVMLNFFWLPANASVAKTFEFNFAVNKDPGNLGWKPKTKFNAESGWRELKRDGTGGYLLSVKAKKPGSLMFIKRQFKEDLAPETEYYVNFEVDFSSNLALNCPRADAGDAFLKAGVYSRNMLPKAKELTENEGLKRMFRPLDWGKDPDADGKNVVKLGSIGYSELDDQECEKPPFRTAALSGHTSTLAKKAIKTNKKGEAWVEIGVHSQAKDVSIYFKKIKVTFETFEPVITSGK